MAGIFGKRDGVPSSNVRREDHWVAPNDRVTVYAMLLSILVSLAFSIVPMALVWPEGAPKVAIGS